MVDRLCHFLFRPSIIFNNFFFFSLLNLCSRFSLPLMFLSNSIFFFFGTIRSFSIETHSVSTSFSSFFYISCFSRNIERTTTWRMKNFSFIQCLVFPFFLMYVNKHRFFTSVFFFFFFLLFLSLVWFLHRVLRITTIALAFFFLSLVSFLCFSVRII